MIVNLASYCNSCAETGFTTESGCYYLGHDIAYANGTVDFIGCKESCRDVSECVAVMWDIAESKCLMKSSISQTICDNDQYTSGKLCKSFLECKPIRMLFYNS